MAFNRAPWQTEDKTFGPLPSRPIGTASPGFSPRAAREDHTHNLDPLFASQVDNKLAESFNVANFGAREAAADNGPAIQKALDAKEAAGGGDVVLGGKTYAVATGVVVESGMTLADGVITGTGINIVTVHSEGGLRDIEVKESAAAGDTDTVGVNLDAGGSLIWKFDLTRVKVTGSVALGDPNYLGTGIHCDFALEGSMVDIIVEFWNVGINQQNASNANAISGSSKIRQNVTGLKVSDVGFPTDLVMVGGVIEGNRIGVHHDADGRVQLTNVHLEQAIGASFYTDLLISGGARYSGLGSGFYSTNESIVIESGNASAHASYGEVMNGDIDHDGSGVLHIHGPLALFDTTPSTGPIMIYDGSGITGINCSGRNLVLNGFNLVTLNESLTTTGDLTADFVTATGTNAAHFSTDGTVIAKLQALLSAGLVRVGSESDHEAQFIANSVARIRASDDGVGFNNMAPSIQSITGSTDATKLASVIAGLEASGLMTDDTT